MQNFLAYFPDTWKHLLYLWYQLSVSFLLLFSLTLFTLSESLFLATCPLELKTKLGFFQAEVSLRYGAEMNRHQDIRSAHWIFDEERERD